MTVVYSCLGVVNVDINVVAFSLILLPFQSGPLHRLVANVLMLLFALGYYSFYLLI